MGKTILRNLIFWTLLLLLCLWLGCRPQGTGEPPAPLPAITATPTATATPVPTPVPTPSPTPLPIHPDPAIPSPETSLAPLATPAPSFRAEEVPESLRLRQALIPEAALGQFRHKRTGERLCYGSFDGQSAAFYPATRNGKVLPESTPLPEAAVLVSPYAPEKAPKKDGDRWLTVYLGSQSVVCFVAEDGDWTVERVMICSCADAKHTTPLGSHYIYSKYKYKAMTKMNGIMVYAQYASRFRGHYLFHTVPIGGEYRRFHKYGKKQMLIEEYEKLGSPASHGCVRLLVGDAYWVYDNCKRGTTVFVTTDAGPEPPAAPALIYEEPYMNKDHTLGWDPTDPDKENPYREIYPEWFE